ncbi:MAG: hypothetical protein WDZ82_01410 [Candidatus Paceibacterota bacterium]
MKNILVSGFLAVFVFSVFAVPAQALEKDFDTIDNAPEEKERGMSAKQWEKLEKVLRDTPNGDKVVRILKKRLPGIIN